MEAIAKIKILATFLRAGFEEWREYVWRKELDAPYCCDGRECGCGALTVRQIYTQHQGD